jgi:hypothetical protein
MKLVTLVGLLLLFCVLVQSVSNKEVSIRWSSVMKNKLRYPRSDFCETVKHVWKEGSGGRLSWKYRNRSRNMAQCSANFFHPRHTLICQTYGETSHNKNHLRFNDLLYDCPISNYNLRLCNFLQRFAAHLILCGSASNNLCGTRNTFDRYTKYIVRAHLTLCKGTPNTIWSTLNAEHQCTWEMATKLVECSISKR